MPETLGRSCLNLQPQMPALRRATFNSIGGHLRYAKSIDLTLTTARISVHLDELPEAHPHVSCPAALRVTPG